MCFARPDNNLEEDVRMMPLQNLPICSKSTNDEIARLYIYSLKLVLYHVTSMIANIISDNYKFSSRLNRLYAVKGFYHSMKIDQYVKISCIIFDMGKTVTSLKGS